MMKIYTKRGDAGETDLFGGGRVTKNHDRVRAFGSIDVANTAVGLAYSTSGLGGSIRQDLEQVMKLLFCAGAEIATAPKKTAQSLLKKHLQNQIDKEHVLWLEQRIDEHEEELLPLKNFILPCGSDASARIQWARAMVRQAEISLVGLVEQEDVRPEMLQFFNRLSDFLFVLARSANKEAGVQDITWSGTLSTPQTD